MYRLALYVLTFFLMVALALSLAGLFTFTFFDLLFSTAFLTGVCWFSNQFLAWIFKAPTNIESSYITAFILALILLPSSSLSGYAVLLWPALFAMASKYLVAVGRKHIFNPAAFGAAAGYVLFYEGATWWIGNVWMLVPVIAGAFLIVRKIKRFKMVLTFLIIWSAMVLLSYLPTGFGAWQGVISALLYSPIIFFSSIMLTEPLTTPSGSVLRIVYAALVAFLYSPQFHFGSFYFTPELALLSGNIFSYIASPRQKLLLTFQGKTRLASDIFEFIFRPSQKLIFSPGQYLEWTLPHKKPDTRGNRRFFTIASSPSDPDIRLGIKFSKASSSFKQTLLDLSPGTSVSAGQLSGDFTLPDNQNRKLVFIAGGIGITPFVSMIKFLLHSKQQRPIILFYSNRTQEEIVYKDLINHASKKLKILAVYVLTDPSKAPPSWTGEVGRITEQMLLKYLPDPPENTFYVSGTHGMVVSMQDLLSGMGIPKKRIKTDFFPGYA
jgi:ferredoxin-NADP reductase